MKRTEVVQNCDKAVWQKLSTEMCTRWSKNTGQFIFDNNHNINLNQFNQASNESREECCQGTVTVTWRLDKTTLYNYQLRTLQTWRHHSVLVNLHWLPVYKTVIFKTVALMWKCLHGEAPNYLVDLCIPVALTEGCQQLRSASSSYRSDGPTNSVDLHGVYMEHTTCTSVIWWLQTFQHKLKSYGVHQ